MEGDKVVLGGGASAAASEFLVDSDEEMDTGHDNNNNGGLPSPIALERSEQRKAEKMLRKTEEYRTLFNLPAIDFVIQDYHCGFWRGLPYGWWQGRMLVTTNHVLFRGTVGSFAIDVKLRDVVSVNDVRSLLLLDNGLDIFTKSEKLCFGTFVTNGHRDEALVLIRHLLAHPVSFLTKDDLDAEEVDKELHASGSTKDMHASSNNKKVSYPLKLKTAPILHKFGNDSLRFAKLQFGDQTFSVLDGGVEENGPMAKALSGKCEWLYSDIDCVRIRSRPLHLDVRFHKFERLRLCSAEIQAIVIEFYHRSGPGLKVVFEPGPVKPFLYALPRGSLVPRLCQLRDQNLKSFRDSTKKLAAEYDH